MSIYQEMVAAGVQIDNHESDLYVPVTAGTTAILARYPGLRRSKFISQIEKTPWYDIAFAYDPYWERVRQRSSKKGEVNNDCQAD